jgi:baseplate J-like protein
MSDIQPPPVRLDPVTFPGGPPYDAAYFREAVAAELASNVHWEPVDSHGVPDQASAALIGVFARFCEIVVQHLNEVPNKNLLAFLDLLGTSRLPPQPARVPLTFTLAAGSPVDAVVPVGTQCAAAQLEGEKQPVIFETERELSVVPATLQTLFTVDAERDLFAQHPALVNRTDGVEVRLFSGDTPGEHILYLGTDLLAYPEIDTLTLQVFLLNDVPGQRLIDRVLQWEAWDGTDWQAMQTSEDSTNALQTTGIVEFSNLTARPQLTVGDSQNRWLRARLLTPLGAGALFDDGTIRSLPQTALSHVMGSVALDRSGLPLGAACLNSQILDTSVPYMPFGERPRPGDTFYLGSEAFGAHGATVTLDITLVNPAQDSQPPVTTPSITPTQGSPDLLLDWEIWTSQSWRPLGHSSVSGSVPDDAPVFDDASHAFMRSQPLTVRLPINEPEGRGSILRTSINGIETYWIRAKISAGNYGGEARYVPDPETDGFRLEPTTLAPPIVQQIRVARRLTTTGQVVEMLAFDNLVFKSISSTTGGTIFDAMPAQPPTVYAAFSLPPDRATFPRRTISLYHSVASTRYATKTVPLAPDLSIQTVVDDTAHHLLTLTNPGTAPATFHIELIPGALHYALTLADAPLEPGEAADFTVTASVPDDFAGSLPFRDRCFLQVRNPGDDAIFSIALETRIGEPPPRQRNVRWEYWNGTAWKALTVADGTARFTQSGLIEFFGPQDMVFGEHFGTGGYWLRAIFEADDSPNEPRVRAILPNTTFAAQTATVRNELLGSSDATENQRFHTARTPVLAGQQLEVRETGPLSAEDLDALEAAHGTTGVTPAAGGRDNEVWVRWIEVSDLYASGSQDRHYILDHITGEVTFGNGVSGRIPPRGAGNVRMARYQTGGGAKGNRAAGTIVQLKNTVPYVESVFNAEAAGGGVAAETTDSLIERAPRTLRHGNRAVAAEDYEDLARLASPEVARAKCVSARALQIDPIADEAVPGAVSVIIVPDSTDVRPLPSVELLARVEQFLRSRQPATVEVAAVGPLYVRVDVTVEVALASLDATSQVEADIRAHLAAFLHPLTGGRDGTGWDFGRQPQISDLHAVVSEVTDVDHIRRLSLAQVEDVTGARKTGRFLVYSGRHDIVLTFTHAE